VVRSVGNLAVADVLVGNNGVLCGTRLDSTPGSLTGFHCVIYNLIIYERRDNTTL
jgi:hypothetical protein